MKGDAGLDAARAGSVGACEKISGFRLRGDGLFQVTGGGKPEGLAGGVGGQADVGEDRIKTEVVPIDAAVAIRSRPAGGLGEFAAHAGGDGSSRSCDQGGLEEGPGSPWGRGVHLGGGVVGGEDGAAGVQELEEQAAGISSANRVDRSRVGVGLKTVGVAGHGVGGAGEPGSSARLPAHVGAVDLEGSRPGVGYKLDGATVINARARGQFISGGTRQGTRACPTGGKRIGAGGEGVGQDRVGGVRRTRPAGRQAIGGLLKSSVLQRVGVSGDGDRQDQVGSTHQVGGLDLQVEGAELARGAVEEDTGFSRGSVKARVRCGR